MYADREAGLAGFWDTVRGWIPPSISKWQPGRILTDDMKRRLEQEEVERKLREFQERYGAGTYREKLTALPAWALPAALAVVVLAMRK